MPTYDYECTKCGHTFEAFQQMSDKPLTKCPKCDKKLRRLIGSGAGLIFKGSGFYATDYRKKSKSEPPKGASVCPKANEGCHGCPSNQQ
ncbi:MAG: FmdB family zinc ribbon protein [Candidatus Omnitrophota bacterium]